MCIFETILNTRATGMVFQRKHLKVQKQVREVVMKEYSNYREKYGHNIFVLAFCTLLQISGSCWCFSKLPAKRRRAE